MAPLPKKRHSNTRKRIRRDAIKLSLNGITLCSNCNKIARPHLACPHCGFYNGKQVIKIEEEAKVTHRRVE